MGLRVRCLLLTICMLTQMTPVTIHYYSPSAQLDYNVEGISLFHPPYSTQELTTTLSNGSEMALALERPRYSPLISVTNNSRPNQSKIPLIQADDVNTSLISQVPFAVYWGWAGNISLIYWDNDTDTGIVNATFNYTIGYLSGEAIDCGNGSYVIHVNTSLFSTGRYILTVFAWKPGYEPQFGGVWLLVSEVPTELVLYTPTLNRIFGNPDELAVPIGDTIEIGFLYNDTDSSDGYVGGLSGADVSCSIRGPSIPVGVLVQAVEVNPGNYTVCLNTTSPELATALSEETYFLQISVEMQFRVRNDQLVWIQIIDVPTEAYIVSSDMIGDGHTYLSEGVNYSLILIYIDTWHNYQRIAGANIAASSSDCEHVSILSYQEEPTQPGFYSLVISANDPEGGFELCSCTLSIVIEKENHESQHIQMYFQVILEPTPRSPPEPNPFLLIAIALLSFSSVLVLDRSARYRKGDEDGIETPESGNEVEQASISLFSIIYFGSLLVIVFVIVGIVFIVHRLVVVPLLYALLQIASIVVAPLIPFALSFRRLQQTERRKDRYMILLIVFCLTVYILVRIFYPPYASTIMIM